MTDVAFECWVAKFYWQKVESSKKRGIEFNLTLTSVRNMLRSKKCYYTGMAMTRPPYNSNGYIEPGYKARTTDITIDRIDNRLGYIKGNVRSCSRYANGLKAVLEDPSNSYEMKHFIRMAKVIEKDMRK